MKPGSILRYLGVGFLMVISGPVAAPADEMMGPQEPEASETHLLRVLPPWAYLEGNFGVGYAGTSVNSGSAPSLRELGPGIFAAYRYQHRFLFGIRSDLRFVNQTSDYDPQVGNRAGTRWNYLSPSVAVKLGPVWARTDFQFLGSYHLIAKTPENLSVAYGSPLGFRLEALYPVWDRVVAALAFETVGFGSQTVGSAPSASLGNRFRIWDIHLGGGYVF